MVVLAVLLGLLLLPVVVDAVRHGELRRLAIRNINRRRGEAVLVVAGSMLGTAIITSAFVVGDTLGASIRDTARTTLGPADVSVQTLDVGQLAELAARLADPPVAGTDGVLPLVIARAPVATPADAAGERRAEPHGVLVEVDFEAARRLGSDPAITGFAGAGPTPTGDEAVLTAALADHLQLGVGDTVEVYAYGTERAFRVRDVIESVGVAGFGGGGGRGVFGAAQAGARSVLVPPGTLAALRATPSGAPGPAGSAAPPTGFVLVSVEGGVYESAGRIDTVLPEVERRLQGVAGVQVTPVKQDLLEQADAVGRQFTELFSTVGGFSVIAGVLLLVNIFVMLAEERKVELGMLRAVGMKRGRLVRGFGMEGAAYATAAAVAGALVGIGVGRVIVYVTEGLFSRGDLGIDVTFRFAAEPASILTGLAIGLVISLVTVWATSLRISRLNVIAAIRDLPDPPGVSHRTRSLALGAAGVVAGGLLFAAGLAGARAGALAGLPIAAFSAIPLLARLLPRRLAVNVLCAVALVWPIAVFSVLPGVMDGADIALFVVQGVLLVAAAVTLVTVNDEAFGQLAERLSVAGRGLSMRLGLAYPLARRFRTALLLGMYALVIFTLTFMAVFSRLFAEQAPRFTEEVRAGHHLLVESNPGNPVSTEALLEQPEVEAVAPILRAFPHFTAHYQPEPMPWAVTGIDERLLAHGVPVLASRVPEYATDEEAFRAVLADPGLAVVSEFFLQRGGGPPIDRLRSGQTFTMINPASGEARELTVVGVLSADWMFTGPMVGAGGLVDLLGPQAVPTRHYVRLAAGVEPDEAGVALTGRFLANGADARSFETIIRSNLSQQEGFIGLMEGFLGLGLLIGIAGLGVVMVRAVRERRRQIGMLRAMGFPARTVRGAFLLEATFIALQGILIGVTLGLVTSYQLLANSSTFGDSDLGFLVPWAGLAVLLAVPLGASLLAAAWPAGQASRIRPAVALRIAE